MLLSLCAAEYGSGSVSGSCNDFQFEPEITASLGVYLHANTNWVESIHSELEIVDIAALRGEGESTRRAGPR